MAVVLGVFAVVAAFKPGADITNTAWVDEGATAEVTKAGTEAIETLYTYSYETIDQDFEKARGYLNDAKRDEFDSTADTTKEAAIQTKTATQASVTDIGVTVLDGDRAELLAHMNVSATGDAVAQGSAATPLSIKMEKIDGKWVLSDISDSEADPDARKELSRNEIRARCAGARRIVVSGNANRFPSDRLHDWMGICCCGVGFGSSGEPGAGAFRARNPGAHQLASPISFTRQAPASCGSRWRR